MGELGSGQGSEARHNSVFWSWRPAPDPWCPMRLLQPICPSWGNTDSGRPLSPDRGVEELARIHSPEQTSAFKDFAVKLLNTAVIKN